MTTTTASKTYRITEVPEHITLTGSVETLSDQITVNGVNFCVMNRGGGRLMLGYGANVAYGGKGEVHGTAHKVRQLRKLGLTVEEVA
jgi:hypothetical protein